MEGLFFSGEQKLRWPTSKSMQPVLAPIPHLYELHDKTVPPGESWYFCDKDWGYVLRSEPQTPRPSLSFYRCRSTKTIQLTGGKIRKEKTRIHAQRIHVVVVIFQSRVYVKRDVQVRFTVGFK